MSVDTTIIKRLQKGSPLEFIEMDTNLDHLKSGVDEALATISGSVSTSLQSLNNRVTQAEAVANSASTIATNLSGVVGQNRIALTTTINANDTAINKRVNDLTATVSNNYTFVTTHLNGKLIDAVAPTNGGLLVFDATSDKYLNKPYISQSYIDTHFNGKELDGTSPVDNDVSVYSTVSGKFVYKQLPTVMPTPETEIVTVSNQALTGNQILNQELNLTANRFYGVSVLTTGLTSGQSFKLELFGDKDGNSDFTKLLYSSTFTFALQTDTSQAWYYRDSKNTKKLRVRLTNLGSDAITVGIVVTMEPF